MFKGHHRRVETHDHHKDVPILAIPNSSKSTPFSKIPNMKTEDFPLSKSSSAHNTDLTDAQLVITRDADGRHRINQITYKSEEDLTSQSHSCAHHQKSKIQSARGTGRILPKQSSPSTDQDYSSYTPSSSIEHERRQYSEGFIDNIDNSTYAESENDFDITDIGDALRLNHDHTTMDEDSLESCEGVLETKKKLFSSPMVSNMKIKSGGVCTAFYLAQKQRQANRSNTLPNVVGAMAKEERICKTTIQRKSSNFSQRSQSTECIDKNPFNLDRDSGFDEQDFRSERLHSSYDDNSSLSSVKSARSSSHQRSISSDLNNPIYRENKAYELRLKALNDQSTRTMPIVHRYRKNTQANIYMRYQ